MGYPQTRQNTASGSLPSHNIVHRNFTCNFYLCHFLELCFGWFGDQVAFCQVNALSTSCSSHNVLLADFTDYLCHSTCCFVCYLLLIVHVHFSSVLNSCKRNGIFIPFHRLIDSGHHLLRLIYKSPHFSMDRS